MTQRAPLPEGFATGSFTIAAARAAGVSPSRLRSLDLASPYRGVRTVGMPADIAAMAAAFAQRMRPHHVFAGITAARLWGLPVASTWHAEERLVIGVPAGATRTRVRNVRVRSFDATRLESGTRDGLRLLGPASAVLSMARETPHRDLVVLLDALITPSERYPDLRLARRPHTDVAALRAFAERCRGLGGASAFASAVDDARAGADSPQETRCRLAIVAAGLPEPVVQFAVWVGGERVAEIDLAYPELLIAIEYEGEHHLTDAAQWAKDIRRQELLESLGWIVIRATKADLRDRGAGLVERVRRAIARRAQIA